MIQRTPETARRVPDRRGHFGPYGGQFAPETLMPALAELEGAYRRLTREKGFKAELNGLLTTYVGRATPLYFAERLTERLGGARVYLKREDLCHTGAHKINNTVKAGLRMRRVRRRVQTTSAR